MQQVDIYLSALVAYPEFSEQIIQAASNDSKITVRNLLAFRNISNQILGEHEG